MNGGVKLFKMNRTQQRVFKSIFTQPNVFSQPNAQDTIAVLQIKNFKPLTKLVPPPSPISNPSISRRLHSAARNSPSSNSSFILHEPEPHNPTSPPPPLVLLFGWADASHLKLHQYSHLYLLAGCSTAQYILPSTFIFQHSQEVPSLMVLLHSRLASLDLPSRPVLIHCLSTTGVLCYQGLSAALANQGESMDINGVVWDYGPVGSCWRFLMDPAWQQLEGGQEDQGSNLVEGQGSRLVEDQGSRLAINSHEDGRSKMVIHSQTDFHIPSDYLEKDVLPLKGVTANWENKPGTMTHLKRDKEKFSRSVRKFVSGSSHIDCKTGLIFWYDLVWSLANLR